MLTRRQLKHCIDSGNYLVDPHQGRYDLICAAGTDPYTQCGLTRLICISHLKEFELHHLSNAYLGRVGVDQDAMDLQIKALWEVLAETRSSVELFKTEKSLPTSRWDKRYYEPCRQEFVGCLQVRSKTVLSVGSGWGATEIALMQAGCKVTAIPIDAVIGMHMEKNGIRVLPPELDRALGMVKGTRFDGVLMSEVLQHIEEPVQLLMKVSPLVQEGGLLVGTITNFSPARRLAAMAMGKSMGRVNGGYRKTTMHLAGKGRLRSWLKKGGFRPTVLAYHDQPATGRPQGIMRRFDALTFPTIFFTSAKS
jgi:2-polyprenyl-3-methyl-5-hydroxy-6-metoxy-1,4-benzoquinol methylase